MEAFYQSKEEVLNQLKTSPSGLNNEADTSLEKEIGENVSQFTDVGILIPIIGGENIIGKLKDPDSWIRNRLRYCIWHNCKKPERKRKNLLRVNPQLNEPLYTRPVCTVV